MMINHNRELRKRSLGAAAKYCEHCGVTIRYNNLSHHIEIKRVHENLTCKVHCELMKLKQIRALARGLNTI